MPAVLSLDKFRLITVIPGHVCGAGGAAGGERRGALGRGVACWEAGPTGLGLFGCAFEGEGGIEAKGLACTAGKGDRPSNGAER